MSFSYILRFIGSGKEWVINTVPCRFSQGPTKFPKDIQQIVWSSQAALLLEDVDKSQTGVESGLNQ